MRVARLLFLLLLGLGWTLPARAARVKDVASLYGVRENALVGYGLVVGLNRSGDSTQNAAAVHALANRLQGLGVTMSEDDIQARNVAVVMVTANLPAGSRPGSRVDVLVSSAGDARSLEGGILLLTPLFAANGLNVASAQGAVTVGGYAVASGGDAQVRNHPTVGMISRGATVEIEPPNALDLGAAATLDWVLNTPDFTNAARLAAAIDGALGEPASRVVDAGTVRVRVPEAWRGRQPELVARMEGLELDLDHVGRVVVNERTGTVVMGADITLSEVAVAHGGLTIEVRDQVSVSQPAPLADGETVAVHDREVRVREAAGRVTMIDGVTVGEVVNALNAMGVSPRDLIVILQAIRAAGGLHAEIESR